MTKNVRLAAPFVSVRKKIFRPACVWLMVVLAILSETSSARAATLPDGFVETLIASGISSPTSMALAPDGRMFVCEQGGKLRVIKDGALLSTSFVTLSVDNQGERGLLGVAFDPDFTTNRYVYVYYTTSTTPIHNRVSRFTASSSNGDIAEPGSEKILLELDDLTTAINHNGGALHFGSDGKLYIAVGENATSSNAQTLSNLLGKMLRINADGTIPTNNPFYSTAIGKNRAIWTLGLRNPFTFAVHPGAGDIFINDVGQDTWEEINEGIAGANYGWPNDEGPSTNPQYTNPLYAYNHTTGAVTGCAITGGAFYNPAVVQFPPSYVGDYFFADYCGGWIKKYDPVSGAVSNFAAGIAFPVNLQVADDGSLYYLAIGKGSSAGVVFKVDYTAGQAPSITLEPTSQTAPNDGAVTFSVAAAGTAPLNYQWQRDGENISGAISTSYTLSPVSLADSGATFRCVVSNAYGSATSNAATLTVLVNNPPTATIITPATETETQYAAGTTISYSGNGMDQEDGALPPSAYTWEIVFHHDTHTHPFIPPTSGATTGSFLIPNLGETSANVWYRIHLTVQDSAGFTATTYQDIYPQTATLQLETNPPGLQVTLEGQPVTTPASILSVVGMIRTLGAFSPQTLGGFRYIFASWSDSGADTHTIASPAANTTYTATHQVVSPIASLIAAYSFDAGSGTTLTDESGRGNNGTIKGATWSAEGKFGGALAFNGVDNWVTINDTAALDFTNGMTLEAWVYPTSTTDWRTVLVKEQAGQPSVYGLFASTGPGLRPSGKVYLATGSNERVYGTGALLANTWSHLAVTYDGATLRFCVNGVLVASRALSGLIATSSFPLRIGGNSVFGEFFKGRIDDIRIYNKALSPDEIAKDMNTPVALLAMPAGPVAAYSFDEGKGSTLTDFSGEGNSGVISGAAWVPQDGKFGGALFFDGENDWVTINDTDALDLSSTLTLEAWIYPTSVTDWRSVLVKERAGQPSAYGLFAANGLTPSPAGKVYLTNGSNERLYGATALSLNTWSHIAFTYDGETMRFYLNGEQISSRVSKGTVFTSKDPLRIGGNSVYGEFFQGRIDEVRIYDRALRIGEIQKDMQTPVSP